MKEIEEQKAEAIQPQKAILCTEQKSTKGIILTDKGNVIWSIYQPHIEKRDNGILPGGIDFLKQYCGSDSKSEPVLWLTEMKDAKLVTEARRESMSGGYMGPGVDIWEITKFDGTESLIWVYSVGYSEGYLWEMFETKAALNKYLKDLGKRHWISLECLECGAKYSEPGYVEPGSMGCVRCN